ncbi:MAG: histidine kinase [Bryobacteraceae bacterium]
MPRTARPAVTKKKAKASAAKLSPRIPKQTPVDSLAKESVRLRTKLRKAGRVLHDDIASMLAVAGLRLQLAQLDHPEATARLSEIAEALEGAVDHVRKLSRDVEPTPVRRSGLKNALVDLAESASRNVQILVTLKYSVEAQIPQDAADAIYLATAAAVQDAVSRKGVRKLTIAASGGKKVLVRVMYDQSGTGSAPGLQTARLLAQAAGLFFDISSPKRTGAAQTKKGTIVSIQYAL